MFVSCWLFHNYSSGKQILIDVFCDGMGYDVHSLEGAWAVLNVDIDGIANGNANGSNGDDKIVVERGLNYWNNENASTFSLPENILVRFCKSYCLLEI